MPVVRVSTTRLYDRTPVPGSNGGAYAFLRMGTPFFDPWGDHQNVVDHKRAKHFASEVVYAQSRWWALATAVIDDQNGCWATNRIPGGILEPAYYLVAKKNPELAKEISGTLMVAAVADKNDPKVKINRFLVHNPMWTWNTCGQSQAHFWGLLPVDENNYARESQEGGGKIELFASDSGAFAYLYQAYRVPVMLANELNH